MGSSPVHADTSTVTSRKHKSFMCLMPTLLMPPDGSFLGFLLGTVATFIFFLLIMRWLFRRED